MRIIFGHVLSMHILYKAYLKLIVLRSRLLCLDQLGSIEQYTSAHAADRLLIASAKCCTDHLSRCASQHCHYLHECIFFRVLRSSCCTTRLPTPNRPGAEPRRPHELPCTNKYLRYMTHRTPLRPLAAPVRYPRTSGPHQPEYRLLRLAWSNP
jgi:hypothetical protein